MNKIILAVIGSLVLGTALSSRAFRLVPSPISWRKKERSHRETKQHRVRFAPARWPISLWKMSAASLKFCRISEQDSKDLKIFLNIRRIVGLIPKVVVTR